ncbi:MAG: class I SAM-dependent methyltransferase [Rhabdochlamydiaceae bacterium]|nr:class I SAM-dependent methyltransferase [Candidatus Amphrikana amoebophyrae]
MAIPEIAPHRQLTPGEALLAYKEVNREQLKDFLRNIFQQIIVEKFIPIYEAAVNRDGATAASIYAELLAKAPEAQKGFLGHNIDRIKALRGTVKPLADNVGKLMDPKMPKEHYVEITMPGRMIRFIARKMGLSGIVTIINDTFSMVQSGLYWYFKAEKQELTYGPISLKDDRKVDVISAFAGIHHCPAEKIDAFVQSISDRLNPGGVFLLRDHNCETQELAWVIHSVFNACTGVTSEAEAAEVRNFQPQSYWDAKLEEHGLLRVSGNKRETGLIREGDPTANGLVKYVKAPTDRASAKLFLREWMTAQVDGHYTRKNIRTVLTSVEWLNVESVQNIGNYENCYDYPYMRDVIQVWKAFFSSVNAARKMTSLRETLLSNEMFENVVLLTLMTAEYIPKAIVYGVFCAISHITRHLPDALYGARDEQWEGVSTHYKNWYKGYADRLEQTPHYAQKYVEYISSYWSNFAHKWRSSDRYTISMIFDRQTVKNFYVGLSMTLDLLFRAAVATPMYKMYGEGGDARTIGVMLEKPTEEQTFDEWGLQPIPRMISHAAKPAAVVLPRYSELVPQLRNLINAGVKVTEIAGQTKIKVEVVVSHETSKKMSSFDRFVSSRPKLDSTEDKLVSLLVPVEELGDFLSTESAARVHRVYDF